MTNKEPAGNAPGSPPQLDSNAVRLTAREWVVAASLVVLVAILTPLVWQRLEPFDPPQDFRVPYVSSDDYWLYQRLGDRVSRDARIPIIGDSVVWGEYVDPSHTLSHFLSEMPGLASQLGEARFANCGLNGTHPLALQGLVRDYAQDVRDTRVILHCNLLWMSSTERDLRTDKEIAFNHPRLVPQFVPDIPCYRAPVDERMGIVIDRRIPLRGWVNHLRVADFDGLDVHRWTLAHPYANPFEQIRWRPRQPKDEPHSPPIAWTERGIQAQDIPWIDLDTSLQWRAFRGTADLLRERGNSVFVIVGPFNEHMLTDESRARYRALSQQAEAWLGNQGIAFFAPAPLPSDEYADASHPLNAGYARLAELVASDAGFQRWLGR